MPGRRVCGLSAIADFNGDGVADLAVPSLDRRSLRFISFNGGVRELARKPLPAPAASDFVIEWEGSKPIVAVMPPSALKARCKIDGQDDTLKAMAGALETFTAAAGN